MARKHHSEAAESLAVGDRPAISGRAGPRDAEGLAHCLARLRRDRGDVMSVEESGAAVCSFPGDLGVCGDGTRLFQEIEDLARYIHAAKAEIVALNPVDIRETFLPTAAGELDAIVQSTEKATGAIMDATEAVDAVSAEAPADLAERLRDATTRIYEACSFQDLTGQRITKVVRMLACVEERVDALVRAFDPVGRMASTPAPEDNVQQAGNRGRASVHAVGDRDADGALLNGPQDEGEAMKQDDIDALLNGS